MKTTEHVEYLLRQGKKPKELVELGFPKAVVTRVHRQLKEKKTASQPKTLKGGSELKSHPQAAEVSSATGPQIGPKLASLEREIEGLKSRVESLEAIKNDLMDVETRISGTPALGLKHHFKCECGASGFVAIRIRCTKCGRETWWGWFPKQ